MRFSVATGVQIEEQPLHRILGRLHVHLLFYRYAAGILKPDAAALRLPPRGPAHLPPGARELPCLRAQGDCAGRRAVAGPVRRTPTRTGEVPVGSRGCQLLGSRGNREDQAQRPDKTVGTKLGRDKNGGSPRGGWQERGAEYPTVRSAPS